MFLADSASFLLFLAVMLCVRGDLGWSPRSERESTVSYRTVLGDRVFLRFVALNFVFFAAGLAVSDLVPVYAKDEAGVGAGWVGVIYAFNALAIIAFQLPITKLIEGRRRSIGLALMSAIWAAAWLLVLAAGLVLHATSAAVVLSAALALFGLGECLHSSIQGPLAFDLATPDGRGRYLAVSGLAVPVALIAGPAAGGLLLAVSPHLLWPLAAGVCLAAGWAMLRLEPSLPVHARVTPRGCAVRDERLERLARVVVDYSLALRPGDLVRMEGPDAAAPLLSALFRRAVAVGARPYIDVELAGVAEWFVANAGDEQLVSAPEFRVQEMEEIDASLTVWGEVNTNAFSGVAEARQALWLEGRRPLARRRRERWEQGETRWCGLAYPTHGLAQSAHMTLADHEDFVFTACAVQDDGDPVAHWQTLSTEIHAVARTLQRYRELHFVGPDTDLRLEVSGRRWLAGDGHVNMPDGECYTSPVETRTEGTVSFSHPVFDHGRSFEDVRLRFAGGKIVAAEASRGQSYLDALLEVDGARVLGEVGFGLNYGIDRFTGNPLFDEKIGGTIHVAIGNSYRAAGGVNDSPVHIDMVCDLRREGEIHADGELIWRDGRFLDGVVAQRAVRPR